MLRHIAISTLVLGAGLGLGACSSGSGTGGGGGNGNAGQWFSTYVDEVCLQIDTCCKAAGKESSQNACRQFLTFFASGSVGKAQYDAAAGQQCLAELTAQKGQCNEEAPAICERVLTGSSPKGGACETSMDCAPITGGSVTCAFGEEASFCQHELPAAEGVPCGFDTYENEEVYECTDSPDFYCDSTDVCRKRVALGGTCEYDNCVTGAYCNNESVCSPRIALDSACSSSTECVDGAYCDQTCKPKKQVGEPCTFGECDGYCNEGVCEGESSGGTICFTDD